MKKIALLLSLLLTTSSVLAADYTLSVTIDSSCLRGGEITKEEFYFNVFSGERQLLHKEPKIARHKLSTYEVELKDQAESLAVKVEFMEDDVWEDDYKAKCNLGLDTSGPGKATSTCSASNVNASTRSHCSEAIRLELEKH